MAREFVTPTMLAATQTQRELSLGATPQEAQAMGLLTWCAAQACVELGISPFSGSGTVTYDEQCGAAAATAYAQSVLDSSHPYRENVDLEVSDVLSGYYGQVISESEYAQRQQILRQLAGMFDQRF